MASYQFILARPSGGASGSLISDHDTDELALAHAWEIGDVFNIDVWQGVRWVGERPCHVRLKEKESEANAWLAGNAASSNSKDL